MRTSGPLTGQVFVQAGNGLPVKLASLIASSGEGSVYRTSQSGYVAKIYNAPQPDHFRKLSAMIARPPRDPAAPGVSIAWPVAILVHRSGAPAGFLMPEIADAKRPLLLYVPKTRLADASGVDWFYLHSAALNLARLFRAIHGFGYVIGDVKPENLLVNASMQVCAIDTDSFQVPDPASGTVHRCTVGTPDYTPPELWGVKFEEIDRTVRHDLFGLAALIYLFLFGKHPFSGGILPEGMAGMETGERIKAGLWQWNRAVPLAPHRGAVPLDIVHPALEKLFRRSFDRGGQRPDMRPSAEEWESALEAAIADLVWCSASPLHVHGGHRACPWCESAQAGVDLFPAPASLSSSSFSHVLARLDRHVRDGDHAAAAALIARHPQLTSDPRASRARAETERFAKALAQFARFRDAIARSPDHDEDNLKLLRTAPPEVLALAERNAETAPRLDRLRALARAIDEIETGILSAAPKEGLHAGAGEEALIAVVRAHATILRDAPATFPRYRERLKEARDRVEALKALATAEATGQTRAVAIVLDTHGARLRDITEMQARQDEFAHIQRLADKLGDFVAAASRPGADPEIVCAMWEAAPDLADAAIAEEATPDLEGHRPSETYAQFAARRKGLRLLAQVLDQLAPAGRPLAQATLDAASAEIATHVTANGTIPVLSPLHRRIAMIKTAAGTMARLRRLAASGETAVLDLAQCWRAYEGSPLVIEADLRTAIAGATDLLSAVETFAAAAADPARSEEDLLRLWADRTLDHPAAAKASAGTGTIADRIDLARRRIAAGTALSQAIAAADAGDRRTHAAETALLVAWETRRDALADWPEAQARFAPRVALARDRLARAAALAEAVTAGRIEAAAVAWGTDGALAAFDAAEGHAAAGARAARLVDAVTQALARLDADASDEAGARAVLADVAQAEGEAPLSLLGGRSATAFSGHLERRAAFRRQLAACEAGEASALFALAAMWDADFGDDPQLAASPVLKDARALAARWTVVRTAAEADEDATVARFWGEPRLEAAPDFAPAAERVRAALQRHLDARPAFAPCPPDEPPPSPDPRSRLLWDWQDRDVTHAVVMIGDRGVDERARRETFTRHVVTREDFSAQGGALLALSGRMMTAAVFPAFMVGGHAVRAKAAIVIQEQARRLLRYRLSAVRGDRQEIELIADRALTLPPLRLVLEQDGPADEIVAQFAAVPLGTDARVVLPLVSRVNGIGPRRIVRLDYDAPEDAAWLEIAHPEPRDRGMVVRR